MTQFFHTEGDENKDLEEAIALSLIQLTLTDEERQVLKAVEEESKLTAQIQPATLHSRLHTPQEPLFTSPPIVRQPSKDEFRNPPRNKTNLDVESSLQSFKPKSSVKPKKELFEAEMKFDQEIKRLENEQSTNARFGQRYHFESDDEGEEHALPKKSIRTVTPTTTTTTTTTTTSTNTSLSRNIHTPKHNNSQSSSTNQSVRQYRLRSNDNINTRLANTTKTGSEKKLPLSTSTTLPNVNPTFDSIPSREIFTNNTTNSIINKKYNTPVIIPENRKLNLKTPVTQKQPIIYISGDNNNNDYTDYDDYADYVYSIPIPIINERNDELVAASLYADIEDEDVIYAPNDNNISFSTIPNTVNNNKLDEILAQNYEEEENENVINNIRNEDAINDAVIDEAIARSLQDEFDPPTPSLPSVPAVITRLNRSRPLLANRTPVDVDRMSYEQLLTLDENVKKRGLTKSEIDALPIMEFKSTMAHQSSSCSICMGEYVVRDKLRRLPCKHYYHKECIDKWLSENKTCPICKHSINERVTKKN